MVVIMLKNKFVNTAFTAVIISFGAFSLAACSTIVEGTSQKITVNSTPAGATCKLERENEVIGMIDSTPNTVSIEKDKHDITIVCNKAGYEQASYLNKSSVAGATVGNVLAVGLIGWGVDSASGSDNKYDSPVNITLAKK